MILIFIEYQSTRPVSRISSSVSRLLFSAHFSDLNFHRLMFSSFGRYFEPSSRWIFDYQFSSKVRTRR